MHLSISLLNDGYQVYGIDNLNNYYDPKLKNNRLGKLSQNKNFQFSKVDINDLKSLEFIFKKFKPEKVVNLAAQAGVRYSIKNPHAYIQTNIGGFTNIIECCRNFEVQGLIYASSSSVYGKNKKIPFFEEDEVNNPTSIYAASKISNEHISKTYNHLYGLNSTGLRYFTVYGPWGRPDMALYIFTEKIMKNKPLSVFNHGHMQRDFTYIDDIIRGTKSAIKKNYEYQIFNLGNSRSEDLMDMISIIEDFLGKKAKIQFKDMQPGDVRHTFADITNASKLLDYKPLISIKEGIPKFIEWFNNYTL